MIFLLKGLSQSGKSSLARRIARRFEFAVPNWGMTPSDIAEWRKGLARFRSEGQDWVTVPEDYFSEGHVNLDRVRALAQYRWRDELPPIPAEASQEALRNWLEVASRAVTGGALFPRFFELVSSLVVPGGVVVEGTLLGKDQSDFRLLQLLEFRFATVPKLKAWVRREPYSPEPPSDPSAHRWWVEVGGEVFDHEEFLSCLTRGPSGAVEVTGRLAAQVYTRPWVAEGVAR